MISQAVFSWVIGISLLTALNVQAQDRSGGQPASSANAGFILAPGVTGIPAPPGAGGPEKKFPEFTQVVQGAKEFDGLFKLYQKDDNLFMEISPAQLGRPFLVPMAVAKGLGMGGLTLNFDEQWVILFQRVGDKIQVIRRNLRFQARKGTPVAKAVDITYTDSIIMALRIATLNPARGAVLVNLNEMFFNDFAQLGLGMVDPGRTQWFKVKTFPKNIELQLQVTFTGRRIADESVIDARGNTVVLHYGLVALPEEGYQPRLADKRVGYFLSVVKDFSSDERDHDFVRYVNRWRLEPVSAPKPGKLAPPKKKIVYWIENSVPDQYRQYVREGILEWNKAFEKAGFRDAIEVRQQEGEDFDPEDINYSTFRWITTGRGFAMGPSRANPLTGEILDADIIFDADMARSWRMQFLFSNTNALSGPIGLVQAGREGWLIGRQPVQMMLLGGIDPAKQGQPVDAETRLRLLRSGLCQCSSCMSQQMFLGGLQLLADGQLKPGDKLPEDLIGQGIKHVVMHEVGHTLGLRHNFKASTMLKTEQLHDVNLTRAKGLVGSVMDYSPVNLAPKGVKQGDFFSQTLGPYDYWAIEYAYKPLTGGTEGEYAELKKLASAGAAPGHDYGTDEDLMNPDPFVNQWDLGADPLQFGIEQAHRAGELAQKIADRLIEDGAGYERLRQAFHVILNQYGDAAYLASGYIGGEIYNRDHKGDPSGRDPLVSVPASQQREALKFLRDKILNEATYKFPPHLLRRLAADRWLHWGNDGAFFAGESSVHNRVLAIQRVVLNQLLAAGTLTRIQNAALKVDPKENPMTVAEVFRTLTDAVWGDILVPPAKGKDGKGTFTSSVLRRNLQREHLKRLADMVLGRGAGGGMFIFLGGGNVPADAKSLARMHLNEVANQIDSLLKSTAISIDDTARAHLLECRERIQKTLAASMTATVE